MLPEPIFTPATKAELGRARRERHASSASPSRSGPSSPGRCATSRSSIYARGAAYAASRRDHPRRHQARVRAGRADGALVLGDEVLTPDSSRFWPADGYEPGSAQPSFDKQYVRDWLTSPESGWDRHGGDAAAPAARRRRRGHPRALRRGLHPAHRAGLAAGAVSRTCVPLPGCSAGVHAQVHRRSRRWGLMGACSSARSWSPPPVSGPALPSPRRSALATPSTPAACPLTLLVGPRPHPEVAAFAAARRRAGDAVLLHGTREAARRRPSVPAPARASRRGCAWRGRCAAEALGLAVDGFAAPGWSSSAGTRRALAAAGLGLLVDDAGVHRLAPGGAPATAWRVPSCGPARGRPRRRRPTPPSRRRARARPPHRRRGRRDRRLSRLVDAALARGRTPPRRASSSGAPAGRTARGPAATRSTGRSRRRCACASRRHLTGRSHPARERSGRRCPRGARVLNRP